MSEPKAEKTCPSCGSKQIEITEEERSLPVAMGETRSYKAVIDKCLNCGATGDFQKVNDARITTLLEQGRKETMGIIVDNLVRDKGLSMAYMERALELPARTMMRWKNGDYSAGALALLRIVNTYPWTIDVADTKFDSQYATQRLALEGMNTTFQLAKKALSLENTNPKYLINATFELKMTIATPLGTMPNQPAVVASQL